MLQLQKNVWFVNEGEDELKAFFSCEGCEYVQQKKSQGPRHVTNIMKATVR